MQLSVRAAISPVKKSDHSMTGGENWSVYDLSPVNNVWRGVTGYGQSD